MADENAGASRPLMIEPTLSPDVVNTIGPVLDCMETCGGLSLAECDRVRRELTFFSRFKELVVTVNRAGDMCRRMLGASVEVCLPEKAPMFPREERGNEIVILHNEDYNDRLVHPLLEQIVQSSSNYGVTVIEDVIKPGDIVTDKLLHHLLQRNVRMVVPIITPQALHSRHWSTLGYEFCVQNEDLVCPVFAYPEGTRERLLEVLGRRCAGMLDIPSTEVPMTEERLPIDTISLVSAKVIKKGANDLILVWFYKEKGMTGEENGPLIEEAAEQSGKTVDEVINFISKYRERKGDRLKQASVPIEVEMGGPEMRALYELACRKGTCQVYYIRLILVGKHRNGKTSLANSLLLLQFNKDEEITDGIVITPCLVTGKEKWKVTKGIRNLQFPHAAATEMKKMAAEKPAAPKRTDGDNDPKQTKRTPGRDKRDPVTKGVEMKKMAAEKPAAPKRTDGDNDPKQTKRTPGRDKRDPVTKGPGTSSQPRPVSRHSNEGGATRQTEEQTEEFRLASRLFLDKDDLSNVIGSKEQPALSIWDFAGHDVYYSSHHVFYSHYAVFLLTLNLMKALSDPLEPEPDSSTEEALQLKTEGDLVNYHLESIRAHTRPGKRSLRDGDEEAYPKRDYDPPVIVVGTHKDQLEQENVAVTVEDFFSKVKEHLKGKAISKHVYDRCFAIDNTKRDPEDPELSDLRDAILKVARAQNHMGKSIPISWLELKSILMKMEKKGKKYCSLQDVIAATECSHVPEENVVIILSFFHLCGDILFFNNPELRNFVVLDPQWFVDVQKTIITIPKFRDHEVKDKWEHLETTGELEDSLITHVWTKRQKELNCDHKLIYHKDKLLKMMEQFDVVLPCSTESEEAVGATSKSKPTTYFVPSLLTTVKERAILYPSGTGCSKPIFVVFNDKFFPVGVYHRLVIASMRRYNKRKPQNAYASCAKFVTSNPRQTFVITKEFYYMKVELLSSIRRESDCFSHGPAVRQGLDEDLREIINKWIPGIRYNWCFQCCCNDHKRKNTKTLKTTHPFQSNEKEPSAQSPRSKELDEDIFVPIDTASVSEWFAEGDVVCKTYAPATTKIDVIGLTHWFSKPKKSQSESHRATQQSHTTREVITFCTIKRGAAVTEPNDRGMRGDCPNLGFDLDRAEKPGGKRKSKTRHVGQRSDSGPPIKRRKQDIDMEDNRTGHNEPSTSAAMSVLLVADEYGKSYRGTSPTNRQVALFLKHHGATVHCTALQASDNDKRCAKEDDVILYLPVKPRGDLRPPSLEWLTFDHKSRYPDLPQDLKCIVGHAGITSGAAKSIQRDRCHHAKLILFNHDMPEVTELYKGTEKGMAAKKKVAGILEDAKNADAVFSLGRRIFDHFEPMYQPLCESKPREHFLFCPRPSSAFEDISVRPGGGEKVVLFVGGVSEEVKLKGHDLVARAMGEVAEKISNVRLRVCVVNEDDWEASNRILEENMHSGKIKPILLLCETQEDIAQQMQQAHLFLMPSRAEPFGLIGLEAIAAGIPVLISDKSGLADLIKDLIKEEKGHPEMRYRIVQTSVNESDLDVTAKEWAERIVDTLNYTEFEFNKAAAFKKTLLGSKYWEESNRNLLRVCGLNN
ncbi:hypothetical protein Bbelb_306070 [Branchiostoma belcheri]|nr:hypothetical protein Bbelb_306070 [Branchiostoma belcheri]